MRKNNNIKISKRERIIDYIIITIIVLILAFVTYRFKNYFGSDNDWVTQHTIFPDYFRTIFYKTGNILPNITFQLGAGQNIFNLVYYGFLSPYTLLSYFFPFMSMILYYQIINIIILIVSGILFYNFIYSHKNDRLICLTSSLIFILGTPFIFHMHRHFMFVNYMPFLIMGLFGVDNYLKKNKKILLIISVFLMIMTSFYYSIPSIMVLSIYFLHEYLNKHKKILIKELVIDIIKYILIIFVGIMLAGVLLLPTAYTLLVGRESQTSISMIKLLIPTTNFHSIFNDSYAIGLSSFGFITLLYLFFTKKRNNIIIAIIISIILFVPLFRFLLNGGLYLREKCFIPFLPLFVYYMSFMLRDIFNKKIDYKKFSLYLIIIWAILFYNNRLLRLYGILFLFIISLFLYNKFKKKIIVILVITLSLTSKLYYETINNYDLSFDVYNTYFNSDVSNTINDINISDNSFYRTSNLYIPNKTVNKIYNDNYYTTSMYASTFNHLYYDFIRNVFKLNMSEINNMFFPANSDLLFNSFMGVKYLYSERDLGFGYKNIGNNMYLNNYALPIIYARNNILSINDFNNYNYVNKEELLLNNVIVDGYSNNSLIDFNSEKLLLDYEIVSKDGIEIKESNDSYDLIVDKKGEMNVKINNDISDKLLLIDISKLESGKCNDELISLTINSINNTLPCKDSYYYTNNTTFHYMLGDNKNDIKLEFTKGKYHIDNIEAYAINYQDVVSFNYDELKNIKISDNEIVGNINIKEDGYLVTSIPYDSGFDIYIDNNKVDKEKVNISFLGSKIMSGYHEIKIVYHSPWLNYGYIVSGLGIITLIGIIIFDRKKKVK